jgi:hypothetical protein
MTIFWIQLCGIENSRQQMYIIIKVWHNIFEHNELYQRFQKWSYFGMFS